MRGGRVPVRLFGMLRSLCVITALLVLGSGAMRLCRPVVVIGGACMAVGTHSIFLVPEEALRKHARRLLLPVPRRQKERNTDVPTLPLEPLHSTTARLMHPHAPPVTNA